MKRVLLSVQLLLCFAVVSLAQSPDAIQQYINTYKDLAIAEMQRTGVPAAIKLAQGIHETSAGTSDLVIKSNNHFGIKCKSNWTGESVSHDDDARGECFRKYPSAIDSYKDHSDFLKNSPRYASLFSLDPTDYQAWAWGLKKAGYATNPKYPQTLIRLIENYHLQDYTLIALNKIPADRNAEIVKNDPQLLVNNNVIEKTDAVAQTEPPAVSPAYPEGEFKMNETKVVFAQKGTSYLAIAQQYNIPLARLFEFNEMAPAEALSTDQLIYLQRKRKTGKSPFHIVKPGETLWSIAQDEAIRLEALQEYNWLKDGMQPAPGETLSLQTKANSVPKLQVKNNYSVMPVSSSTGNH